MEISQIYYLKLYIGITGYNHESSAALVDGKGFLIDYFRGVP